MNKKQHRQWKDFSSTEKASMFVLGLIEMVITSIALWDLTHRPKSQVRGNKIIWGLVVTLIQPFGPIPYFLFGRKKEVTLA